jgi:MFS family permease
VVSRDKLILLAGLITYGMGQSLLFVIFTPLARQLGLTEWQVGVIIAASNMALAFSAPRWGRASESLGRRRVFLVGLGGFALGYAALALGVQAGLNGLVTAWPLFAVLIALRLAYGLVVGGINPAATAYIADTTDEKSRGQGMALVAMSGGLGTILGPAFGGALAAITPVFPMYAAAALALLAAAWAWVGLPEPARRAGAGAKAELRAWDPRIRPYLIGWFVVFGVFTGVQTITAGYIADALGITAVTAAQRTVMVAMLSMAFCTLLVQAVVLQAWKPPPGLMLKVAFVLMTAALLLLAASPGLLPLYIAYAIFGLSFGFAAPGLNAAASLAVTAAEQGAAGGLLTAAPTVGMIVGPILCGIVYQAAPTAPMLGGAVLCALMALGWFFIRVPEPRAA